jgi:hypothetical protein
MLLIMVVEPLLPSLIEFLHSVPAPVVRLRGDVTPARLFTEPAVWLQKSVGDWTTYSGDGYWINHGGGTMDQDYWFFGWLLQKKVTEKLVFGDNAD